MPDLNYKADVVVIGGGLAGIATALELLDHNKSVVLNERAKTSSGGSRACRSAASLWLARPSRSAPASKTASILRFEIGLPTANWARTMSGHAAGRKLTSLNRSRWSDGGCTSTA